MTKNRWLDVARLQVHANYMKNAGFSEVAKIDETIIEKFNETRTIRITGKNVDDIDLSKLGNLIQQANEKSSKFSLNGIIKGLKLPKEVKKSSEETKE
jgi:hypothetical protein